jgi:hypothetical protein
LNCGAIAEKRELDYINELGGGNSKTGRKDASSDREKFLISLNNLTSLAISYLKTDGLLSICKTYLTLEVCC